MVQNTTVASACSEARYCRNASSALKVKTSAMPSSTTVCTVTPRACEMKWMNIVATSAIRKALTGTA